MLGAVDSRPSKTEIRQLRALLRGENAKWPDRMKEMPIEEWPNSMKAMALDLDAKSIPRRAWRSRRFAAVLFDEGMKKPNRLSVNRALIADDGGFVDGISWDELMQIKSECGFAAYDALELYPSDSTVVDVANMRHLWILESRSRLNWNR